MIENPNTQNKIISSVICCNWSNKQLWKNKTKGEKIWQNGFQKSKSIEEHILKVILLEVFTVKFSKLKKMTMI